MQYVTEYDATNISRIQPVKSDNNGKGRYFPFDNDNNISYNYIFSIT